MKWNESLRTLLLGRITQITLATVVAGLFVFFLFDRVIMTLYTRQGSERPVPQLVGLSREAAIGFADSIGFRVVEERSKLAGGDVTEGTVLEQRPLAGSLAKPGRKIFVVPAAPAPRDLVPDLLGLELRDAQLRCKNAGLISGETEVRYRFASYMPNGRIVDQTPKAGTPIDPGETVQITVSMGPEPERFFVPMIIDQSLSEARVTLRETGLKLGKIIRKQTSLYPSGTVIGQSIKSGEEVERGTSIDVVVAVQERGE